MAPPQFVAAATAARLILSDARKTDAGMAQEPAGQVGMKQRAHSASWRFTPRTSGTTGRRRTAELRRGLLAGRVRPGDLRRCLRWRHAAFRIRGVGADAVLGRCGNVGHAFACPGLVGWIVDSPLPRRGVSSTRHSVSTRRKTEQMLCPIWWLQARQLGVSCVGA
jgi:hypothetical protein